MTSGTGRGRTFIRRGQRPWDAFGRAASRALVATVGAKYAKHPRNFPLVRIDLSKIEYHKVDAGKLARHSRS
jgi:hypothetical protein